jgi:AcrR family transcriptional regulator
MNVRFLLGYASAMPKISEEHRAEKRQQIIAATLRCVERDGFHKTTMAAVIKESGLSAGSVYTYFGGKKHIIRAIAESGLTTISEAITSFVPDAGSDEVVLPPERAIEAATQHPSTSPKSSASTSPGSPCSPGPRPPATPRSVN